MLIVRTLMLFNANLLRMKLTAHLFKVAKMSICLQVKFRSPSPQKINLIGLMPLRMSVLQARLGRL